MFLEEVLLPYVEDCRKICSLLMTTCSLLAMGSKCEYKIPQLTDEDMLFVGGSTFVVAEALEIL